MYSFPPFMNQPQTTGRYLVLLNEDDVDAGVQAIGNSTGVQDFAHSQDFENNAIEPEVLAGSDSVVFDELGVAVVSLDPNQAQSLNAVVSDRTTGLIMEPERIVHAFSEDPLTRALAELDPDQAINLSADYLRGYRDAVSQFVDRLLERESEIEAAEGGGTLPESEAQITWGITATQSNTSPYSGRGIKVAVLDTGMDLTHPDFVGRTIISKSFIEGEAVQDGNGHGTHCIGTACGPSSSAILPRYGVAYNADIYAGKVLSDDGSGADGGILAGINWAIANRCQVISMSLGAMVMPKQSYSKVYEQVGKRAIKRRSLIIAAAGNDSWRQFGIIIPVSHPANCPSIMAVAALNSKLRVAPFSNGGLNEKGGQIDIAAPGVDVYSAWPMPTRYNIISGTSMATPHVAGIAALYAEATGATGNDLWTQLTQGARRLPRLSRDVGSGLAQAVQEIAVG